MKDATIAVEDKNFYLNSGVDIGGMIRAIWIDLQEGEIIAGGSTITQQVARNLLLSEDERLEKSIRRKTREILLAWQLTQNYSKDEILALYLNQIYYGGLAYGIEAASQTYFAKSAKDLLLPECALLAGLPQAPSIYNPFTNPDLALERQRVVLRLMEEQKFITSAQRLDAENSPLSYTSEPYPIKAPHFIWLVKNELDALYEKGALNPRQSLEIRTTLDLDYQETAESILTRHIQSLQSKNVNNAALVALDPKSGDVLTLIGSVDYFDTSIEGAVNMATTPRQTGSVFKPFIYALALDPQTPPVWTLATPFLDISTTFTTKKGKAYIPVNYDRKEHGIIPLREALASSLNIPAVLTLQEVGIENTLELAAELGISSLDSPNEYDLSLVLGGGKVSLLEFSTAYSVFANGGYLRPSSVILDIKNADGETLYARKEVPLKKVMDPRVAWLINDILSDDDARAIGFGENSTLKIDRIAAVKTGTTTNFHDNWTIGYTPDLVVGVWAGNSNYEAMQGVTGLDGAAPIWHETMRAFLEGKPERPFEQPSGLKEVEVCVFSGDLPTSLCPLTRREWFIEGTEPTQADTLYQEVKIDSATGLLADDSTPDYRIQSLVVLDLPIEALPWARRQGLPVLTDLIGQNRADDARVLLLSPAPNTSYRLDPNFDLSAQRLLVEAVVAEGAERVDLWVDDFLLESFSAPPYKTWWSLDLGEHIFFAEAVFSDGKRVRSSPVHITVRIRE